MSSISKLSNWISRLFFILIALFLSVENQSHAQLWQGAPPQNARTWTLGAFGEFYFNPNDLMVLSQAVYGLTNEVQLEGRLGFGTLDPYYGLFGKFALLRRKVLDIAIFAGFHRQAVSYFDFSMILSHSYSRVQVYAGPYILVPLENGLPVGISLIPGFNVQLDKRTRLYSEVNLNMNDSRAAASAGVRYFF